ncbi:hypothetical protein GC163_11430 [bacterium]|nr:hypothetical protein [bacterium]
MRPTFRAILVSGMFALGLPSGLQAADLEEAKRQLAAWQQSFQSIRIKARISSEAATNYRFEGSKVTKDWRDYDWIWEASGRFRFESVGGHDGGHRSRSLRLANLAKKYTCSFDGDSEFAREVMIQDIISVNVSQGGFDQPMWILWDSDSHSWIGDRIPSVSEAVVTADGMLDVSGDPLGFSDGYYGSRYVVTLDPEHGYLPQRFRYEPHNHDRYTVEEFQEVQPDFWFPQRGRILDVMTIDGQPREFLQSWEISQVELNPELPDSLFFPPMHDDTIVTNHITGQKYRYGDPITVLITEVPRRPAEHESDPGPNWILIITLSVISVLLWRGVKGLYARRNQ